MGVEYHMIKIIKKPEIIADYINGNTRVILKEDGTRILTTNDDDFELEYPLNIDMTITERCDLGCPFCYANCTPEGKHADLLSKYYIHQFNPGQELAINLNACDHPQLFPFLQKMKDMGVFVNGTVNQVHFMKYHKLLKKMCDNHLLWGIGVSLRKPTDEFISAVKEFPNAVIHCINGIVSVDDINYMADHDLKLLILGYKDIGRGEAYKEDNKLQVAIRQHRLKNMLPDLFEKFKVVSFDNLALDQLRVKSYLSQEYWDLIYQGDEGSKTFFLDAVHDTFSISSLESQDRMIPIDGRSIKEMFQEIRSLTTCTKDKC